MFTNLASSVVVDCNCSLCWLGRQTKAKYRISTNARALASQQILQFHAGVGPARSTYPLRCAGLLTLLNVVIFVRSPLFICMLMPSRSRSWAGGCLFSTNWLKLFSGLFSLLFWELRRLVLSWNIWTPSENPWKADAFKQTQWVECMLPLDSTGTIYSILYNWQML